MPRIARRGLERLDRLGRQRWTVERTLAWMARFRRLTIRTERRADIHRALTSLACSLTWLKQIRRFCWGPLQSGPMDWRVVPPLASLRAFEAAARAGCLSAAARELDVTHAAIAQQVRGLAVLYGPLRTGSGEYHVLTRPERLSARCDAFAAWLKRMAAEETPDG